MASSPLNNKYAIVGLGITTVGHFPGYSGRALAAQAARMAIEDAGLKNEDIDGAVDGCTLANYTQLDVKPARDAAFRMAGIELKDIDVVEFYDCFSSEVLFQLEDYGWCKKGEGGPFVAAGNIGPGGTIPVNTGGGMLSSHHHSGFTPLAEAIIQIRGEGGARQVKDARIALATGHGGEVLGPGMCSSHTCVILGK